MNDKLLPIGSVVLLKEAKKRLMIIGYYPTIISEEGNTTTYDYSGCLFPEGIIDSENVLLFNRTDIDQIYYYGLMDGEQNEFMTSLDEIVKSEITNNNIMPKVEVNQQQNSPIN